MNTPKLAIAMNYIDENLISGAIDYKPVHCKNNTYFWKHIAAAACFCIIVIGSIFAYHQHTQPEDMTDLHEITQGGVNAEIIRASGFELFNRVEVEGRFIPMRRSLRMLLSVNLFLIVKQ